MEKTSTTNTQHRHENKTTDPYVQPSQTPYLLNLMSLWLSFFVLFVLLFCSYYCYLFLLFLLLFVVLSKDNKYQTNFYVHSFDIEQYKLLLHAILASGRINAKQEESLNNFRQQHQITQEQHVDVLNQLNFSIQQFEGMRQVVKQYKWTNIHIKIQTKKLVRQMWFLI